MASFDFDGFDLGSFDASSFDLDDAQIIVTLSPWRTYRVMPERRGMVVLADKRSTEPVA